MAPVARKYKKKSKAERLDNRAVSFQKKKVRISRVYVGDQMVLRSKHKMLKKFKLRGCFVVVNKKLSAEALQWLERDGQSVRLPPLPAFPNEPIGGDEPNPNPLQQNEPTEANELADDEPKENPLQENEPNEPLERLERADERPAMPLSSSRISGKRRFSVAGGLFFSVQENVREVGTDFLTKVAKGSKIISQPAVPEVQNEFDPFRRLDNPPFALRGRQRSASQDGFFQKFIPILNTIQE